LVLKGHGFSRAADGAEESRALAPEKMLKEGQYSDMKQLLSNCKNRAKSEWLVAFGKGSKNESSCISQKDLRQVQGHHPPRGGQGDLRERKAQAAPGLI
jgi:hypothetical protein